MIKEKKVRNPIKFEEGVSVTVTFDFDPSTSKSFEQDSKYSDTGKATKYLVSVNKDEIIFATPALYDKLRNYSKGDTVVITFLEKRWLVTSDSPTKMAGNANMQNIQRVVENTESTVLLRKIAMDIDLIKGHLFGSSKTNDNENKDTKEEDIDF